MKSQCPKPHNITASQSVWITPYSTKSRWCSSMQSSSSHIGTTCSNMQPFMTMWYPLHPWGHDPRRSLEWEQAWCLQTSHFRLSGICAHPKHALWQTSCQIISMHIPEACDTGCIIGQARGWWIHKSRSKQVDEMRWHHEWCGMTKLWCRQWRGCEVVVHVWGCIPLCESPLGIGSTIHFHMFGLSVVYKTSTWDP